MKFLIVGASYFVFVFFKAFQQRNVAFLHYGWIVPTSLAMGLAEVTIHSLIALSVYTDGVGIITVFYGLSIGLGGGLGCLGGMYLHSKAVEKKNPELIKEPKQAIK